MKYSLTTGFLTGIIACLVVITVSRYKWHRSIPETVAQFATMPNNFVYVAFFWLMGKCERSFQPYHASQ
jgi:hypothetical protein